MGTPDYAASYLNELIKAGRRPFAVITQPDRPTGRSNYIEPTPVKKVAMKNGIETYQPNDIRDPKWAEMLHKLAPDIIVVVAFGQIIPKSILQIPMKGCINVHPSLLPKYRGASPLQATILNGDADTGVTIMCMDEKMDHGPILAQEMIRLDTRETIQSLREKTTILGVKLLLTVLKHIENDAINSNEQNHSQATYTKLLKLEDGKIDFMQESADEIDRKIRALNPEPGTWVMLQGRRLKILEAHPSLTESNVSKIHGLYISSNGTQKTLCAQCASGILQIDTVHLEGKKPMGGIEFIRGNAKLLQ